jgi:cyclic pyranopterin phosphate synthase
MTPGEIERIVRVAREFHVRSVKFTGGEPLVRSDMEEIVDRTVRHIADVSMTTNGSMLAERAEPLRAAGLKRVNISADTFDPGAFREIRRGHVGPVLKGIEAALAAGLKPVKINMVLFRATLPHLPAMIEHVKANEGLKLQLIEFMPELVGQSDWRVDLEEVRRELEAKADRVIVREMHHRRIYCFNGSEVELVDPVDNPEFCFNCRRLRVTHDGRLKGCLNRDDDLVPTRDLELDALRAAFRAVVAARVPYYGVYRRNLSAQPGQTIDGAVSGW